MVAIPTGDEYKPNGNDESSDESVSSGVNEDELEEDKEIDEDDEIEVIFFIVLPVFGNTIISCITLWISCGMK